MREAVIDVFGGYSCPTCSGTRIHPTDSGQLVCVTCLNDGRVTGAYLVRPVHRPPVELYGRVKLNQWVPDCELGKVDRWAHRRKAARRGKTVERWIGQVADRAEENERLAERRQKRVKALKRLNRIKRRALKAEKIDRRDARIVRRMISTGKNTGPLRAWWYTR